jgi:hypothetical protein
LPGRRHLAALTSSSCPRLLALFIEEITVKSSSAQDLLTDFQVRCIGLITAEWALLEVIVSIAIWTACNLDREKGLSVTADLGSLAKIKMLSSLAQVHFGSNPDAAHVLTRLTEITDEMAHLNSGRNIVCHSIWLPELFSNRLRSKRMSTRGGKLKEMPLSKTDDELMDLYQRITAAKADLEELQTEWAVYPHPHPGADEA